MSQTDHFKRLEEKINRAIEHIEKLTLENDALKADNSEYSESLKESRRLLMETRLRQTETSQRLREKLRVVLHKIDSINDL